MNAAFCVSADADAATIITKWWFASRTAVSKISPQELSRHRKTANTKPPTLIGIQISDKNWTFTWERWNRFVSLALSLSVWFTVDIFRIFVIINKLTDSAFDWHRLMKNTFSSDLEIYDLIFINLCTINQIACSPRMCEYNIRTWYALDGASLAFVASSVVHSDKKIGCCAFEKWDDSVNHSLRNNVKLCLQSNHNFWHWKFTTAIRWVHILSLIFAYCKYTWPCTKSKWTPMTHSPKYGHSKSAEKSTD